MREDLSKKIEIAFPFMRRDAGAEKSIYENYGFELGDGWFSVIWGLCEDIVAAYKKAGKEIDLIPVQVKEKFGTLRFYYDVAGRKKAIHAFDFLGEGSIRFQENDTPLYNEIREIVHKWEKESGHVCEYCGKAGELRKDLRWIRTLCDDCYSKGGMK